MDSGVRSMAVLIADYDSRGDQSRHDKKQRFESFAKNDLLDESGHDEYALYMNDVMERVSELEAVRSWLLKYIELCESPSHKQTNLSLEEVELETMNAKQKLREVERKLLRYRRALDSQDD